MSNLLNTYQSSLRFPVMVLACALIVLSIVDGGQPAGLLLLLLLTPVAIFAKTTLDSTKKKWLFAFFLPILVSIPLFISSKTGEALDAPARYFAAAVCFIALSHYVIRSEFILRSASFASIVTLAYNYSLFEYARVDWGIGVLESGYIGVVMLALSISQFSLDKGKLVWRIISIVGIICALIVVVKTGSRGTWPAIFFVCFLQLLLVPLSLQKKLLISCFGAVILVFAFLYIPSLNQRVELSIEEVKSYYYENDHANSFGYRFDFWRIAIRGFVESPIWGVSYDRRSEIMDEFIAQYPESQDIGNDGRSSSHNEVLNAMSKKGLLGLAAILLLYLIPLQFFIRHLKRGNSWQVRRVAAAGVGVVATMMICGLSEAPLMNVRVATTYSFVLVFLFHGISHLIKQQEQREAASKTQV